MKNENAKHTPGPWIIGNPSAMRPTFTIYNRPFGMGDIAEVEIEANARLIAAAPDLLLALESVVTQADAQRKAGDEVCTIGRGMIEGLRAAIAKAKGE